MEPQSDINNLENVSNSVDNAKIVRPIADPGKDKFQLARRNTIKTLLIVGLCKLYS